MARFHSWLLAALALVPLLGIPETVNAAAPTCFPETGFCIDGRFRDYWQQNGALPVFGFPIGPAQNEVNRETGQRYLTQWFERNRFELHPENAAPYDVLLGRLGDDLLRQQGIDWQLQLRESGPRDGCLWFAQTGHNICDQGDGMGFKSYWQSHGLRDERLDAYGHSLALFGLPLTEARPEVNLADGQSYLTQWFERARLEWHPDKPDAYKVLLGLLGNEAAARRVAQVGADVVGAPVGSRDALYWVEMHDGRTELVGLDIAGNRKVTISDQPDMVAPVASGASLAWVERSPDGQRQSIIVASIFGRVTMNKWIVLESGGEGTVSHINSIALDDTTLYYEDGTSGHIGLFARDIETSQEQLIDARGMRPVANDGVLLWSTGTSNGQSGSALLTSWTLHLRMRASGETRMLVTVADIPGVSGTFDMYAVSGDTVVYSFNGPGFDNRVYRYRISTGALAPVSTDAALSPAIIDDTVAWVTNPFFDSDPTFNQAIYTYNLRSSARTTVAQFPNYYTHYVTLVGTRVTYVTRNTQGQSTLYLAT